MNTSDIGGGSLRWAIETANINPGPHIIDFNIPKSDPGYNVVSDVWLIQPNSPLPGLTVGGTTIDGFTQITTQGDINIFGPEVLIDGTNLSPTGWIFSVESNDNEIKGLTITRAGSVGIKIISGAINNTISNNYIGIDPTGTTAWGNGTGIELSDSASFNTVSDNIISGNTSDGIKISQAGTYYNYIETNIIGLDPSGKVPIPNGGHGVMILNGPTSNFIGVGTSERNIISGNGNNGVNISGTGTNGNYVTSNFIGTDISGTTALGNASSGVTLIDGATSNGIQSNLISGNLMHGVHISGSGTDKNFVRLNIIGGDGQDPPNPLPNGLHGVVITDGAESNWIGTSAPEWGNVILSSGWSGVSIFNSNNNTVMLNAIGTNEEGTATNLGNTYYGAANAILPAFSWSGTVSGPNVTATATDNQGNTSEFSAPFGGLSCSPPIAAVSVAPASGLLATTFRFDASGSTDKEDPISALEVQWDWEDDGTYDTPWSTTKIIDHTFKTTGDHFIRLQVRDTDGLTDSIDQLVKVVQFQPAFIPLVLNMPP